MQVNGGGKEQEEVTDTLECKEEMKTLVKLAKANIKAKNKQNAMCNLDQDSFLVAGTSLHDKSNSSHSSGSKNTS